MITRQLLNGTAAALVLATTAMTQAADLDEAQPEGHEETGSQEGDDHQRHGLAPDREAKAPDVVRELVDDTFDHLHGDLGLLAPPPSFGGRAGIPAILPEDRAQWADPGGETVHARI